MERDGVSGVWDGRRGKEVGGEGASGCFCFTQHFPLKRGDSAVSEVVTAMGNEFIE